MSRHAKKIGKRDNLLRTASLRRENVSGRPSTHFTGVTTGSVATKGSSACRIPNGQATNG